MSFFKRKAEELQIKRAERESTRSLEKTFRKSLSELKALFATGPHDLEKLRHSAYPKPIYQGDVGIHAFGLVYHVQPHQFPVLLNLTRQGRKEVSYLHFERVLDGYSLHTIVSPEWRFAQRDVRLLSNDVELLAALSTQGFQPPPPWITLYELGLVLYVTQGDAHFWLNYVWDPFWESLSLEEQDGYLARARMETATYILEGDWAEWVESVRMRDARYRKLED
ncbi:hypothetical protein F3J20_05695 [Paraburkholderia sp. Cy-641]|uniref:hypothetical protein n=1 Tax=Paraburkholderia sp. Cy-641 TaxID=2608337 RepID=UPI0014214BD0|nr:hypothetical protein [Paraburkholderia sp. Cy-641]NIF76895.1 hypothetical protein [Paraburkholderia sp. Cy-641]